MSEAAIRTVDLKKSYGQVQALSGLNLSVPEGSICGFLGLNGAGKTTTMKILLGLTHATAGEVRVLGRDPRDRNEGVEIRKRAAFVSEEKELDGYLTIAQAFQVTRPFFPSWNRDLEERLLRVFGIPLKRRPAALSKGMRTRVALALALPRGAGLFILDEPTDGLDPAMKEEVHQILVSLVAGGATIFFSSHQIAEVEQIADHVCIIDRGREVVAGALDELKDAYRRINVVFDGDVPPQLGVDGIVHLRQEGRVLSLLARENIQGIVERARALRALSVDVAPVTLKEIFLETMKSEPQGGQS